MCEYHMIVLIRWVFIFREEYVPTQIDVCGLKLSVASVKLNLGKTCFRCSNGLVDLPINEMPKIG